MKEIFVITLISILVFLGVGSYASYQLHKNRSNLAVQVMVHLLTK